MFDAEKFGPIHTQPWAIRASENFHNKLKQFNQFHCMNCHEMWPTNTMICKQCKKNPLLLSTQNNMIPNYDMPMNVKKAFEELTMVEEMLISPILPIMSVYRLPGGQMMSRGFVANFT